MQCFSTVLVHSASFNSVSYWNVWKSLLIAIEYVNLELCAETPPGATFLEVIILCITAVVNYYCFY